MDFTPPERRLSWGPRRIHSKCRRESNEAAVVCEAALAPAIGLGDQRVAFVVTTADRRDMIEFAETACPCRIP